MGDTQISTQPQAWQAPAYVIEQVMKKRGRLRIFQYFEPKQSALVVVDMQDFYVRNTPQALAIIPNINRLARAFRARGGKVAWAKMVAGENGRSLWPLYHDFFFSPENASRHRDSLSKGDPGQTLHAALETRADDIYADKRRFSAFFPGHSELPEKLQAHGIQNVAIVGTLTNFCCETSARDAMMLDYRVAMVSDANAARYRQDHAIGFATVFQSFGDVVTTAQLLDEMLIPASDMAEQRTGDQT